MGRSESPVNDLYVAGEQRQGHFRYAATAHVKSDLRDVGGQHLLFLHLSRFFLTDMDTLVTRMGRTWEGGAGSAAWWPPGRRVTELLYSPPCRIVPIAAAVG